MPTQKKVVKNEEKSPTTNKTKKIATGNTKKIVQQRSSSIANKSVTSKSIATNAKPKEEKNNNKNIKSSTNAKPKEEKNNNKNTKSSTNAKAKGEKNNNKNTKSSINTKAIEKKQNGKKEKIDKKETIKFKEKDNNKLVELKEINEIQEVVAREIKQKKKISQVYLNKMYTNVFKNICLAIIIMLYLNFVILGFMNIEQNVLIIDLKVFGIIILIIAICIIEKAYKEESKSYLINAIEILILAISTIMFIYLNLVMPDKLIPIIMLIAYIFAIYYTLKAIIVYINMKKKYYLESMKEILKNGKF